MQKEEFPTFLNEQPTVIFGRTSRELMIIVIGIVVGYVAWGNVVGALPGNGGMALGITLGVMIGILGLVVAITKIASRPLEEWFIVWLSYLVMPRVYLYQQPEEEEIDEALLNEADESQSSDDDESLLEEE